MMALGTGTGMEFLRVAKANHEEVSSAGTTCFLQALGLEVPPTRCDIVCDTHPSFMAFVVRYQPIANPNTSRVTAFFQPLLATKNLRSISRVMTEIHYP